MGRMLKLFHGRVASYCPVTGAPAGLIGDTSDMTNMMKKFTVQTQQEFQAIDLTDQIQSMIEPGFTGLCFVLVSHTTVALLVNERDPELGQDIASLAKVMFNTWGPYKHNFKGVANAAAHMFSAMGGNCAVLPVVDGQLQLGHWQAFWMIEMSGPRSRDLWMCCLS